MKRSIAVACALLAGCTGPMRLSDPVHHNAARSRQLMVLAAVEANNIADADGRLTRQLNIANEVLDRFDKEATVEVLTEATRTLTVAGKDLTGHARLAGWVSVAQLSRRAKDMPHATSAVDRAVTEVEALPDVAERCQYVMGVAEELNNIQGPVPAISLLMKAGGWADAIDNRANRRSARLAFAGALFNLDDYEAGAAVLRKEKDAIWSSDTLLGLASPGSAYVAVATRDADAVARPEAVEAEITTARGVSRRGYEDAPEAAPQQAITPRYGKALGFESIFQGRKESVASEAKR
jgi:hypothetical protein